MQYCSSYLFNYADVRFRRYSKLKPPLGVGQWVMHEFNSDSFDISLHISSYPFTTSNMMIGFNERVSV